MGARDTVQDYVGEGEGGRVKEGEEVMGTE